MKKLIILSVFFSLLCISCNNDPDPQPEEIRTYCNLYHFIPGMGSVEWVVNEFELPEEQLYSSEFLASLVMEAASEEVTITVKHSGTGQLLISETFQAEQDKYYIIIASGSEEDPSLLIREIDSSPPSEGNVKFQVMHSVPGQGGIDVYMGGDTPDHRFVSDLSYLNLTVPFEVVDYDARATIVVSAHSEEYNQDSVLLSSIYNDLIVTGANYLSVVAPSGYQLDDSTLTFWIYDLPQD